jgi:hypothetical protein
VGRLAPQVQPFETDQEAMGFITGKSRQAIDATR